MLYIKQDSKNYITEFKKRFSNFCEKAPVLLSFTVTEDYVQIINEALDSTQENVLTVNWDFSITVKEFIYGIKQILMKRWYPRIIRISISNDIKSNSANQDILETPYIIERVILLKNVFILFNERTQSKEFYEFKGNSYVFLKKAYSLKEDAKILGEQFFSQAVKLENVTRESF